MSDFSAFRTLMPADEIEPIVENHRLALLRVIAVFCAMFGLSLDAKLDKKLDQKLDVKLSSNLESNFDAELDENLELWPNQISRHLKSKILMVLRPAESAARRLIYALMRVRGIVNSAPIIAVKKCLKLKKTDKVQKPEKSDNYTPPFQLFDPRKRFDHPWIKRRLKVSKHPPRILFPMSDTFVFKPVILPAPRDPDNASPRAIIARLAALQNALTNLPNQANRMARLIALRENKAKDPKRFIETAPLRPGNPPGFRRDKRCVQPIDFLLHEVIWICQEAQKHQAKRNLLKPRRDETSSVFRNGLQHRAAHGAG
ncbi:MAG: hypothetical protein U5K75_02615 [Ahrensia sp.]|nr:hypothetical protein [Ahrensia sp.]